MGLRTYIKYFLISTFVVACLFSTQLVLFYGLDRFTPRMLLMPMIAATVFGLMLGKISMLRQELGRAKEDLEERVEERTRDLRDSRDRIRSALQEKEVLLREVHHRVNNNMALVTSLLSLQMSVCKDEASRENLRECRQRVSAMAQVHRNLYSSRSLDNLSISSYIEGLLESLVDSYGRSGSVGLSVKVGDVRLGLDSLVPVGLIINEVATNSLKYAFEGNESPQITIGLNPEGQGNALLVMSDNGPGFRQMDDMHMGTTLGLGIINSLVTQLEGTMELESSGGTRYRIIFPVIYHPDDGDEQE